MGSAESNVVASSGAVTHLSVKIGQTNADSENIIATLGEASVSTLDADQPDDLHQAEPVLLLLIDDAARGLEDVSAGRHVDASAALGELQNKRGAVQARRQRVDA